MKRVVGPAGYTIVETMIFLAVSAALFASAMALIGGQQEKTQFTVTVRDFSSKLQSVIGNVQSGSYNNAAQVSCTENPTTLTLTTGSGGSQGTNGKCVYLGQVMATTDGSTDITFSSLIGLRVDGTGDELTSLGSAKPTMFAATSETYSLHGIDRITVRSNAATLHGVAFLSTLAGYGASGLKTGTTHTNTYPLTALDDAGRQAELRAAPKPYTDQIEICLTSGTRQARMMLTGGAVLYNVGEGLC